MGDVLGASTLMPLARHVSGCGDNAWYRLLHPRWMGPQKELTMFAEVMQGEEIVCMSSTAEDLVGLVVEATKQPAVEAFCGEGLQGALTVYCGGCSLAIQDQLPTVGRNLSKAVSNKPFLTMFTYGEQGVDNLGNNCHGNLMYSLLLFGAPKPPPSYDTKASSSSDCY